MDYDSSKDTLKHILRVSQFLHDFITELLYRAKEHDASKLRSPEKEVYDKYTPKLRTTTYGSEEYNKTLVEMEKEGDNHWKFNPHHPEFYPNGINGMDLVDLIEMVCDWKAASERHNDGDINKSIMINKDRFKMSEQLTQILQNTVKRFLNEEES